MNDDLGNRLKNNYEDRTRYFLPRRTHTIIRIDGKAFHTFTRGFERPFDQRLMTAMDLTTVELCKSIQGAKLGYVQSDEISILLTDFTSVQTDAWFDGNIQKIVSVAASIATSAFNKILLNQMITDKAVYGVVPVTVEFLENIKTAQFDARVFTIPDSINVENYFIWRQQDASRNSVQMVARSLYSHKECENKNNAQLQEMIFAKGQNWNDLPAGEKRGRLIAKEHYLVPIARPNSDSENKGTGVWRSRWVATGAPMFTQDRHILQNLIPKIGEE